MGFCKRLAESRVGQFVIGTFRHKELEPERQKQKPPIDRRALLQEIKERTYAEIYSKVPGEREYSKSETHTGSKTPHRFCCKMPGFYDIAKMIGDDGVRITPAVRTVFLRSITGDPQTCLL